MVSLWINQSGGSMDYAVVLCTPYSVKKGLVNEILKEIVLATESKVVLRKTTILTIRDIELLYPRLITSEVFPRIIGCLMMGEVECLLLVGENIHTRINSIKGKFRYCEGRVSATGLRARFQKDGKSFEFIFHSTDSNRESYEIAARLFGEEFLNITLNLNQEG